MNENTKSNNTEFNRNKQIEEIAQIMVERALREYPSTRTGIDNKVAKDRFADIMRKYANDLYNEGYRKQEWISVEDRMPTIPKHKEDITILGYNGEIHDYIIDSKNRWWGYDGWNTPNGWGITHWMPLPQPPDMKGE